MPNNLVVAIAQNKATFDSCRLYLFELLGKNKEKVIALENSNIETCLPYYIAYIESRDISIQEAMNFYAFEYPSEKYYNLLKIAIVGIFRKLEVNDLNFVPF